jgi:hypothetical protein
LLLLCLLGTTTARSCCTSGTRTLTTFPQRGVRELFHPRGHVFLLRGPVGGAGRAAEGCHGHQVPPAEPDGGGGGGERVRGPGEGGGAPLRRLLPPPQPRIRHVCLILLPIRSLLL